MHAQIEHKHKTSTSAFHDYCDGEGFTTHPLFSAHNDALQIFLHFDEVELCNPLGSKVKIHKLGMYILFIYTYASYTYLIQVHFILPLATFHQSIDLNYPVYIL